MARQSLPAAPSIETTQDRSEQPQTGARARLIGSSRVMATLVGLVEELSRQGNPLLVRGETGTGKELLVQIAHESSQRGGPLVPVNCASISKELAEAAFCGHGKGAFTGADVARIGFIEAASGGTLFLDEIGELDLQVQGHLLRALQERKVVRVGTTRELPVDLYVVAATHRSLEEMVSNGSFRADLYWRIAAQPIDVPPLRERGADVIEIAQHILSTDPSLKQKGYLLADSANRALLSWSWPGNVRELWAVMLRLPRVADGNTIQAAQIREALNMHRKLPLRDKLTVPIASLMAPGTWISARELIELTGLSKASILRRLDDLIRLGMVEAMGSGSRWQYRLRSASSCEELIPAPPGFVINET